MSKFKVGDRVVFRKGCFDEDRGVITELNTGDLFAYEEGDRWFVRWDSDGKVLHIHEDAIEHETVQNTDVLPDVLIINGVKYVRSE